MGQADSPSWLSEMDNLPPLRALLVFDAVGKCMSMKRAAAELAVSPGAVSQQIKLLEDALGMQLISRNSARLQLTEFGQVYHQSISAALQRLRNAHNEALAMRRSNTLLISALPLLASRWLAPRMFEWQQMHPDITMHLEGAISEPQPGAGHVDFRISYHDKIRHFENSVALYTDSLIPVCSPHLAQSGPPLKRPADLLAYRLLTIDWTPILDPPPTWQDWFTLAGVAVKGCNDPFIFSLSSLAIEAALDGRGVALAQHSMIVDDLRAGRLVAPFPYRLKLASPYYFAWQQSVFDKRGARDFHRWLIGLARQQAQIEAEQLAV
jgi:LysR family glycine cleavage system transcriptional activator